MNISKVEHVEPGIKLQGYVYLAHSTHHVYIFTILIRFIISILWYVNYEGKA